MWDLVVLIPDHCLVISHASRLNGYMYSNGTSLSFSDNSAITWCKIIPCRVASLIDIQVKQKDWCQSAFLFTFLNLFKRFRRLKMQVGK